MQSDKNSLEPRIIQYYSYILNMYEVGKPAIKPFDIKKYLILL